MWMIAKNIDFDGGKPIKVLKDKGGMIATFEKKKEAHDFADQLGCENYYLLSYEAWGEM